MYGQRFTSGFAVLLLGWAATRAQGPGVWGTFPLGTIDGEGSVRAMTRFEDAQGSTLVIGGTFRSVAGIAVPSLVRWSPAGWSPLTPPLYAMPPAILPGITALASWAEPGAPASVYVFGGMYTAPPPGSSTPGYFSSARWDGAGWHMLGSGTDQTPLVALAGTANGDSGVFVGGNLLVAGGVTVNHVALWDGGAWRALGGGVASTVTALAVFDTGAGPELFAGGQELLPALGVGHGAARFNGASWVPLGAGLGTPPTCCEPIVSAFAVHDDGSGPALYAGGLFPYFQAGASPNIARWRNGAWEPVGGGLTNVWVRALAVMDDGSGPKLFAGTQCCANGVPAAGRALFRWDGSAWTPVGPGFPVQVDTLAVFDDGTGTALFAGGHRYHPSTAVGPAPTYLPFFDRSQAVAGPQLALFQIGGAGSGAFVVNNGLTPGREVYNLFSIVPCAMQGRGALQGLCSPNPTLPAGTSLVEQILQPVGSLPFHFVAAWPETVFGPYVTSMPMTVDGVCLEIDAGVIIGASAVARITIH